MHIILDSNWLLIAVFGDALVKLSPNLYRKPKFLCTSEDACSYIQPQSKHDQKRHILLNSKLTFGKASLQPPNSIHFVFLDFSPQSLTFDKTVTLQTFEKTLAKVKEGNRVILGYDKIEGLKFPKLAKMVDYWIEPDNMSRDCLIDAVAEKIHSLTNIEYTSPSDSDDLTVAYCANSFCVSNLEEEAEMTEDFLKKIFN